MTRYAMTVQPGAIHGAGRAPTRWPWNLGHRRTIYPLDSKGLRGDGWWMGA
jgi:hypothetical protein